MTTDIGEKEKFIHSYMNGMEDTESTTQEILDSGIIPRLKGYHVRPGKVSDSIFGGQFSYGGENFENPPLTTRDGTPLRLMVRTERISTHDINRGTIPFKDQILAANHNHMLGIVRDLLGASQFYVPGLEDTSVVIAAEDLMQLPVEMVLRGYMAKSSTSTSLYQHFMHGKSTFCGHELPGDLVANGPLPYVMDTPSTKSEEHDESVTPQQLFDIGACTPQQYAHMRSNALMAFGVVSHALRDKGLILVDTKTEHGINRNGKIVSQDELYTLDSSRFWQSEDYEEQQRKFSNHEVDYIQPKSFSKEFARGFSKGEEGYTDDQRAQIALRYMQGIEHLLGKEFIPDMRSRNERVITGLQKCVGELIR